MPSAFTEEQRKYMVDVFLQTNSSRIAKEMFDEKYYPISVSVTCIRGVIKNAGYELQQRGGARQGMNLEQFIKLHDECQGDVQLMAKNSKLSIVRLVVRSRKHNLEIHNIPEDYTKNTRRDCYRKYFCVGRAVK